MVEPPLLPLPTAFAQDHDVRGYLSELATLVNSELAQQLCTTHVSDLLQHDEAWEACMPAEWRRWAAEAYEAACHDGNGLAQGKDGNPSWLELVERLSRGDTRETDPPSLRAYMHECERLALVRTVSNPLQELYASDLNSGPSSSDRTPSVSRSTLAANVADKQKAGTRRSNEAQRGMKPKKIHEVECLAAVVGAVAKRNAGDRDGQDMKTIEHEKGEARTRIKAIVDIGSGKGYLSRTLAQRPYSFRVLALDWSERETLSSRNLDRWAFPAGEEEDALTVRRRERQERGRLKKEEWERKKQAEVQTPGGVQEAEGRERRERSSVSDTTPGSLNVGHSASSAHVSLDERPEVESPSLEAESGRPTADSGAALLSPDTQQPYALLTHATARIDKPSIITEAVTQLLQEPCPKSAADGSTGHRPTGPGRSDRAPLEEGIMLVGLHACGDLMVTMLRALVDDHQRLWKQSQEACSSLRPPSKIAALVGVGCCYNLLSPGNFPLSSTVRTALTPSSPLGSPYKPGSPPNSWFQLALQAPSHWSSTPSEWSQTISGFRNLYWRARLNRDYTAKLGRSTTWGGLDDNRGTGEQVRDNDDDATGRPDGPVQAQARGARLNRLPKHVQKWSQYRDWALSQLVERSRPEQGQRVSSRDRSEAQNEDGNKDEGDKDDDDWSFFRIALFWTIRAHLGPPLEGLLVLDRWCYLVERLGSAECGARIGLHPLEKERLSRSVAIWPVFDASQSRRNLALVVR